MISISTQTAQDSMELWASFDLEMVLPVILQSQAEGSVYDDAGATWIKVQGPISKGEGQIPLLSINL